MQTTSSRVVFLSSSAHSFVNEIDFNNLHYNNGSSPAYTPWGAYGVSKLANLLYAKALADKYKDTKITSVSLHPGVIKTNLWREGPAIFNFFASRIIMDKTIPQGASTTVYACVAPRVDEPDMRGAFLSDCGPILPTTLGQDIQGINRAKLLQVTEYQLAQALSNGSI
jgi:retinol dehydrogenase 12